MAKRKGITVRARVRSIRGEEGYTLIEVLVVVLIIGLLATIAIPSFLNQTTKAFDASAESLAHSAELAAEAYATDHGGSYAGLTATTLGQYDAAIPTASGNGDAYVLSVSNATATGYKVTTSSANGSSTFSIIRSAGVTTRVCTPTGAVHGACANGSW